MLSDFISERILQDIASYTLKGIKNPSIVL